MTSRGTIVLVAVLVALAGCSGLGPAGDDGTATEAQSTTNETTAEDTETTTETTTTDDGDAGNLTALDQQLLDSHSLALLSAGSYSVEVSTSGADSATTTVASVNLTAKSTYEQLTTITSGTAFNLEVYRSPGSDTVYTQVGSGDSASYSSEAATGNFTEREISAPYLITDVSYQQFGTETVDNTTVQRYVANDVGRVTASSEGWGGLVTNISSTVLVDPDRNLVYEIDADYAVSSGGEIVNRSYTVTYSDVGSTTVSEPDWLSEAT